MEIIYQTNILYPEILWERPVHYYKNQGGRIFVLAGSKGGANKPPLVCEAIFRSGTGILTLGYPNTLKSIFEDFLPDAMSLPLPSTYGGSLSADSKLLILEQSKSSDATLIGPGLSENAETIHLIWDLLREIKTPKIICEDAVTSLVKGISVMRNHEEITYLRDYFNKIENLIIIINHDQALKILKALNLSDYPKPDIDFLKNHESKVLEFISSALNSTIILNTVHPVFVSRGKTIIIKVGKTNYVPTNNLVAGVIASFVGQNPKKLCKSIATGLYLISSAKEIASSIKSVIVSSDIIKALPQAIKKAETIY